MRQKINILYVDDEKDNLLAFRSLFRRKYNVLTAEGGAEALAIMESQPIQLVLSDQRMPSMTGLELCHTVSEKYPNTVRMIITGYSEIKTMEEAISQGKIERCLRKPWNLEELTGIINSVLGKEN